MKTIALQNLSLTALLYCIDLYNM